MFKGTIHEQSDCGLRVLANEQNHGLSEVGIMRLPARYQNLANGEVLWARQRARQQKAHCRFRHLETGDATKL
jgi:hypothetical protein